ncbi:hypothetical protein Pmani_018586 [Petrolisthes manimaculis]|uniref:Transposase Tc1-like domain-containing protein n=1 Tax=Petrolisthes manimaculis TaxID=1843537 RepID=A0AAE1PJI7_9EUCA|nr:hypothetical protein Pmani_018586 [Petrolisthes manimaculis]
MSCDSRLNQQGISEQQWAPEVRRACPPACGTRPGAYQPLHPPIALAEETEWYGNLPRGRPPHSTTPAQRRDILQAAETDPQTNAVAIRDSLHLDVCERTVRRVLHEAGVHHRTPAKKEYLNDQHREGRLRFAQQYVDKAEDFWKRVIWTDEKTFSSTCHGRRHCWRWNNTR